MNYQESKQILEEVKKAKKILVNCHRHPDIDSVGSALALLGVLEDLGKEVEVICPTKVDEIYSFLPGFEKIKPIDFDSFEFDSFDLFFCLDSSSSEMIFNDKEFPFPRLVIVNIDHHRTNTNFGEINLVDVKISSSAELLYWVFADWGIKINREVAESLLAGIIGDTGIFKFPGVTPKTLKIAAELMEKGAAKDKIVGQVFQNYSIKEIGLWGEMLKEMHFEEADRFVWTAIDLPTFEAYGKPTSAKEDAATQFAHSVRGTDFGIIMVQTEEEKLTVSLRGKGDFDVSQIAVELGGGGHQAAAGVTIKGLPFEQAVNKVLEVARKYAKKTS